MLLYAMLLLQAVIIVGLLFLQKRLVDEVDEWQARYEEVLTTALNLGLESQAEEDPYLPMDPTQGALVLRVIK